MVLAAMMSVLGGCATTWIDMHERKTCAVLSAGGPAGVAHIGAIEALREEGIRLDCLGGTSMGALVGGIAAFAPRRPLRESYRELASAYAAQTARDTAENAVVGGVIGGAVVGLVTGGATLPLIAGVGAGAGLGAAATDQVDLPRFVTVFDAWSGRAQIEALPVSFVAFFLERSQGRADTKMTLVSARRGSLADAVGRSIANPFIFPGFDPVASGFVDPGADRIAATPIEDTCRAFPDARLVAINVSGEKSTYSAGMNCPLLEVIVDTGPVSTEALRGEGEEFERVARAGYTATRARVGLARR